MLFRFRLALRTQNGLLVRAACVLIACIAPFTAHAAPAPTEVGFTSSPQGHMLVPVSINGSEQLVFVLDTAAGKTVVTPGLAERLELEHLPEGGESTLGVHGKTDNAAVTLGSISVSDVSVSQVRAVVLDLDHITRGQWRLDGILGMDFLTQFDIELDFGSSTVRFYSAASHSSNCAACPAGLEGIAFETIEPGFVVLPVTVDAKAVKAVLDTGAGHSGLNGKAAEALGVELPPMPAGAPSGHGFGLQTGPVRVGDLMLTERATLHVMDHPVMEALGLADRPAMLLGTDQLAGQTVTICHGLGVVYLQ